MIYDVYREWLLNCYFRFLSNNSDKATSRTCTTVFRFKPAIIKKEKLRRTIRISYPTRVTQRGQFCGACGTVG